MGKKKKISWSGVLGLVLAGTLLACRGGMDKRVYFGNLEDGAKVESPFKVEMKAENLIVEPAALGVNEGHGHFHILVDAPVAGSREPIKKDDRHIHYGGGEMETTLDLPVGKHTLVLQFAKGDHVSYDPPIFQQIQVEVTKRNAAPDTLKADSTAMKADSAALKVDSAKIP
jgi:hypothetical protein